MLAYIHILLSKGLFLKKNIRKLKSSTMLIKGAIMTRQYTPWWSLVVNLPATLITETLSFVLVLAKSVSVVLSYKHIDQL